ncbi:MAG: aspartate 1-decarboxylase [Chloroflexi bacterium]|nr:MAG: aspartate 1-decarboxylase [Chloroflexota bacterium]RLC96625.1 MAG: aspartate 1-decarboxylase [Chloroflexota bacterium]
MMRTMLKGKIHRARVTGGNISYEGSITVDRNLMEAADILPYELVHVLDINNGARFQTYVIEGEPGSGEIVLNGAAARLVAKGDLVIILAYCTVSEEEARHIQPRLVYVDANNAIVEQKRGRGWVNDLAESLAAV